MCERSVSVRAYLLPEVAAPEVTCTAPLYPLVDAPEPINIDPLYAPLAVPVDMIIAPLTPAVPALAVCRSITPELVRVL